MKKQRKIKIVFDAGPLVNGQKSGVGYYTHGLISALAENYPDSVELVGHYFDFLGRKKGSELPRANNIRYKRTLLYPGKVPNALRRMGIVLPFELFTKEKGDFHLFPGFLGWPSVFKTPSAPVIHDLSYLEFPQYVSERNRKDLVSFVPGTIQRSSFLVTVSEATKQKIVEHYVVHPSKIVIGHIPPAIAQKISIKVAKDVLKKLKISKRFILFVGTIEPRKNIVGLLRAYEQLPADLQKKYSLVLAGGRGWNDSEIIETLKEAKHKGLDVITTGYVSDGQRIALYQQSSLGILPSHYEGFGMPVLEAMSYGAPVVLSDIPVLREVAGRAAIYFDQDDPADIAKKIEQVLQDDKLQKKLVESGLENLDRFSWKKTAKIVYDAIESAVV